MKHLYGLGLTVAALIVLLVLISMTRKEPFENNYGYEVMQFQYDPNNYHLSCQDNTCKIYTNTGINTIGHAVGSLYMKPQEPNIPSNTGSNTIGHAVGSLYMKPQEPNIPYNTNSAPISYPGSIYGKP